MNLQREAILNALMKLGLQVEEDNIPELGAGICRNVWLNVRDDYALCPVAEIYAVLYELYEDWPHHSGIHCYPIPRADMNERMIDIWQGFGRSYRIQLIDFCITKLIKEQEEDLHHD
jgi:hypothetical protein